MPEDSHSLANYVSVVHGSFVCSCDEAWSVMGNGTVSSTKRSAFVDRFDESCEKAPKMPKEYHGVYLTDYIVFHVGTFESAVSSCEVGVYAVAALNKVDPVA